jgi:hypothetical protein
MINDMVFNLYQIKVILRISQYNFTIKQVALMVALFVAHSVVIIDFIGVLYNGFDV